MKEYGILYMVCVVGRESVKL